MKKNIYYSALGRKLLNNFHTITDNIVIIETDNHVKPIKGNVENPDHIGTEITDFNMYCEVVNQNAVNRAKYKKSIRNIPCKNVVPATYKPVKASCNDGYIGKDVTIEITSLSDNDLFTFYVNDAIKNIKSYIRISCPAYKDMTKEDKVTYRKLNKLFKSCLTIVNNPAFDVSNIWLCKSYRDYFITLDELYKNTMDIMSKDNRDISLLSNIGYNPIYLNDCKGTDAITEIYKTGMIDIFCKSMIKRIAHDSLVKYDKNNKPVIVKKFRGGADTCLDIWMHGYDNPLYEDLRQELFLAMWQYALDDENSIIIDNGQVEFSTYTSKTGRELSLYWKFTQTIRNYLYKNKNYRENLTSLCKTEDKKDNAIRIKVAGKTSDNGTKIEDIEDISVLQEFLLELKNSVSEKMYNRILSTQELRRQGYSLEDISSKLDLNMDAVKNANRIFKKYLSSFKSLDTGILYKRFLYECKIRDIPVKERSKLWEKIKKNKMDYLAGKAL